MKILITGSNGFLAKNLIAQLKNIQEGKDKSFDVNSNFEIFEYDIDTKAELLDEYCKKADFVFNLAGVNRPENQDEFMKGNFGFASTLLDTLKKYSNNCPVMISSSTQAALDNPYGESKKAGEDLMIQYSKETGAKVLIYRFPNIFGKWCRPNYNSAVTTFCHNIAHDLPIQINDRNYQMNLVYIDDVVAELIHTLEGEGTKVQITKFKVHAEEVSFSCYYEVSIVHQITLGEIIDLLCSFKESRSNDNLTIPNMDNAFVKKLYSTYLSYLQENAFAYPLKMNIDNRGSFTEMLKTTDRGQVSINISKPGITKGNHWHHTKNEKFLVVRGKGVIRFRKVQSSISKVQQEKKNFELSTLNFKTIETEKGTVYEYYVSGDKLEVVDIPVGYTHNIENLGNTDMVTVMWVNEIFDPLKPDTFFEKV